MKNIDKLDPSTEKAIISTKERDDAKITNVIATLEGSLPVGGDARGLEKWDELEGLRDEYRIQLLNKSLMLANQILDSLTISLVNAPIRDQINALGVVTEKISALVKELAAVKPRGSSEPGDLQALLPTSSIKRIMERVIELQ